VSDSTPSSSIGGTGETYPAAVIHQHPLAYLLGLEGLALLRAWAGDFDAGFVEDRLAEVRRLLADEALASHPGVDVRRSDTATGYRQWAPSYDEPNTLFDADGPLVHEIVGGLPVGDALDAACGTGRYASHLVGLGHRVIGVDSSPEMLEVAGRRVPSADLRVGDLHALPVDDSSVDLVVCGLALAHVPSPGPVLVEVARVLRPGGSLVLSDAHHELVFRGSVVKALGPGGEPGLVATYRHTTGDVLRAALAAGLEVRRCEEPVRAAGTAETAPTPALSPAASADVVARWDDWPWSLLALVPEAARAAWWTPPVVVWHFQRP
jgi:SAM-dependent methyltransferase